MNGGPHTCGPRFAQGLQMGQVHYLCHQAGTHDAYAQPCSVHVAAWFGKAIVLPVTPSASTWIGSTNGPARKFGMHLPVRRLTVDKSDPSVVASSVAGAEYAIGMEYPKAVGIDGSMIHATDRHPMGIGCG